jgi:two-component system sensor histidine kinase SenX3
VASTSSSGPGPQRRLASALARLGPSSRAETDNVDGLAKSIEEAADAVGYRLDGCETQVRRLEATLGHVLEGVVICDEHGVEVYRNEAASEYVGTRLGGAVAASAIEDHLASARQGNSVQRLLELFSPVRRQLSIRSFPLQDGSFPLPEGAPPLQERQGLPIGGVAIVEDVSERRRVDAIRRDFVANVSHELKTPVGALSLLAETLDGEDDPDVVTRLSARLATEAERLGRIIDDLLDLSRIEANEAPTREVIPLTTVLGQALETLHPLAEARGIELEVGETDRALSLFGDRWELVSAVANLVDNAVKYSEPGGRVAVAATVSEDSAIGVPAVEIAVSDRGIGIPKRDLERIFERFYRVDRARSRTTGGTGLGLSIVRHVVANHGGTVRVESNEGEGSTFTLVLPVSKPAGGVATGGMDA